MTPEALRRRMAHGNVYPAERVDAALGNYFRAGNLGALRELALLWVADRVDEALDEYRARPRDRAAVGDARARAGRTDRRRRRRPARPARRAHGPAGEGRPRRGARPLAGRPDGRGVGRPGTPDGRWSSELGGTYRDVVGDDVGKALVDTARRMNATQIVLGATRRSRLTELLRGSVIRRVIRDSGEEVDVHVISHARAAQRKTPTGAAARQAFPGTGWSPGRSSPQWRSRPSRWSWLRSGTTSGCPACCSSTSCWWSSSRPSAASGRRSPPRSRASSRRTGTSRLPSTRSRSARARTCSRSRSSSSSP